MASFPQIFAATDVHPEGHIGFVTYTGGRGGHDWWARVPVNFHFGEGVVECLGFNLRLWKEGEEWAAMLPSLDEILGRGRTRDDAVRAAALPAALHDRERLASLIAQGREKAADLAARRASREGRAAEAEAARDAKRDRMRRALAAARLHVTDPDLLAGLDDLAALLDDGSRLPRSCDS